MKFTLKKKVYPSVKFWNHFNDVLIYIYLLCFHCFSHYVELFVIYLLLLSMPVIDTFKRIKQKKRWRKQKICCP